MKLDSVIVKPEKPTTSPLLAGFPWGNPQKYPSNTLQAKALASTEEGREVRRFETARGGVRFFLTPIPGLPV